MLNCESRGGVVNEEEDINHKNENDAADIEVNVLLIATKNGTTLSTAANEILPTIRASLNAGLNTEHVLRVLNETSSEESLGDRISVETAFSDDPI